MKNQITMIVGSLVGMLLSGCLSTGLSTRETPSQNYSVYLYSLYPDEKNVEPNSRPKLVLPAEIAVAQIGEVAPPQEMMEMLRKETKFFRSVEGIPGVFELDRHSALSQEKSGEIQALAQTQTQQMKRLARDLGMDYLFLYGGSIDYGSRQTGLGILDLTLIGSYVVPSQEIKGTARASGALVELNSGRVVFVVSAESELQKYATSLGLEGTQDRLLDALRRDVITKLTQVFLQRMEMYQ